MRPLSSNLLWSEGAVIIGLDAVAGKIGQAVAQRAAKAWLDKQRKAGERRSSLAELAAAELSTARQRDKLAHLVEGISHQVGDQLEPLLVAKFSALPENELNAALDAVTIALGDTDLSDRAILDVDADPDELARRIRQHTPTDAGLSESAHRLYDLALDQACRYLVQVVRQLPAFQPRALAEVLSRATAQAAQLDEVLSRLPRTSLRAPQGTDNDDEFTAEYLRYVTNNLDRLELLGLSMRNRPKLALTVAYLSLTVSEEQNRHRKDAVDAGRWFGAVEADRAGTRTRVEAALTDRTLVRGDAGSGKTTLLDWLAVTAARGAFSDQLREWNGHVPLPIRLRRYADAQLPRPEQFLDHAASWLVGVMPAGWVHRCLRSGRALVLVDGVDEVRPNKRHQVREWLHELGTTFPEVKIVVTSRPAAADERWLTAQGFTSVLLEQMSPADVMIFLDRWHEAARNADALPCPVDALPAAQRRLVSQLDSREHLRALAANPLLCAMLCALNLGRTAQLPHNRIELYQSALTMLLELRDAEREVSGLLGAAEKSVLLRDLAWRLTMANRSQLPTAKVREHVGRKVRSMPNTTAEPAAIVTHLLERSGVIREPVPGQVDFVHRTFQEYLAAAEAIQDNQIETLISHAHLDSWWETVVMACGHAQRSQVGELITGILDAADAATGRRARRLRLLAAACLETVTDVQAEVNDRLDEVIRERLVPPRHVRETRSLASIGPRVLHYLPTSLSGMSNAAARATVRTVALTASPEAMARLAMYAADPRFEVQDELAMAWKYFDPERYARDVLADAPLIDGLIEVSSKRMIKHLSTLKNLRSTTVWLPNEEPQTSLDILSGVHNLRHLRMQLDGDIDVSPLEAHPKLETVALFQANRFANLDTLAGLPTLSYLNLRQLSPHQELKFLNLLGELKDLSLGDLASTIDTTPFEGLQSLENLSIELWPTEIDPRVLGNLGQLRRVRLAWQTSPEVLPRFAAALPTLAELVLVGKITADLTPVKKLTSLNHLIVIGPHWGATVDLRPLAGMSIRLELYRDSSYDGVDELGPDVLIKWR
ncbi:NACHT domain-containing protein [Kutzneria kofuensis]|uniref:NACHT domain-containing protein n=1 Tax=Kutzneria kofuensis TaxID=103725 RepID=A0A7W9KCR3_9PSEU|nr:NACHT domain-containing protein [Kutzneria kofuensis]MBB5890203.1 hypothetical protein [Kutzneria kofuensis]